MWFKKLKRQQPRQPIQAATINRIADLAEWASRLRVAAPLALTATPGGPFLRLQQPPPIIRGVVTTAIPTGTAGTPSTTGRITVYLWNGSASSAATTGIVVLNDHTLSASIGVGKVVKAALIDGWYWLIAADC